MGSKRQIHRFGYNGALGFKQKKDRSVTVAERFKISLSF
jgi:hypothetical protein